MHASRRIALGLLALACVPSGMRAQPASTAPATPRTAADSEFRAFLVEFEAGANRFLNGDATLWDANASHGDDVSLFNPFGVAAMGWSEVGPMYAQGGAMLAPSGARMTVGYLEVLVSGDLACTVAIERSTFRLAGQVTSMTGYTRATDLFRKEDGHWKLVHRHMDHLTPPT